jgi:hypothetical protein
MPSISPNTQYSETFDPDYGYAAGTKILYSLNTSLFEEMMNLIIGFLILQ